MFVEQDGYREIQWWKTKAPNISRRFVLKKTLNKNIERMGKRTSSAQLEIQN